MTISAADVSKLRSATGVGMMDAKKALTEAGGDFDQAVELLRKKGAARAAKKADRETSEGRVHTYTHGTGKIGTMVEIQCETDFVARNDAFVDLCNDIALHITAMDPEYLTREEVPEDVVAKEKEIVAEQNAGKPEDVLAKIVEGKMEKYYQEACLMDQKFIKDEDMTISQVMEKAVASLGENMRIARFARFQIS